MFSFPNLSSAAGAAGGASSIVMRMGTDGHLYDNPQDADIHALLDSKFDAEKVEGVKRLLALMAQGCDVSSFFPHVVKNVASTSLEVKKLVYIYLVHYAERRPDEALLSINSFQKDLTDLNPLVRAWALRAMSGIRVHAVAQLVLLAVHKCARDPSPYVRRCAANAIPKLYDLNPTDHDTALQEIIEILLNDKCVGVVGAAAAAFNAVCPENLNLIGAHFKRLCEILPDAEEWGQTILIEILLCYIVARHGIPETSIAFMSGYLKRLSPPMEVSDVNLGDHTDYDPSKEDGNIFGTQEAVMLSRALKKDSSGMDTDNSVSISGTHSDIKLLLLCTSPLLWSRNSAVVLAAAGVHWFLASVEDVKRVIKPLLFLLRSSYDSHYVVLKNLQTFVEAMPSLFEAYFEDFFVRSSDTQYLRAVKLEILSLIATEDSIHAILREFEDYVRHPDRQFAADTIAAIGRCAKRLPFVASSCLKGLLSLVQQSALLLAENCNDKATESKKKNYLEVHSDLVFGANQKINSDDRFESEAFVLTQAVLAIKVILQNNPSEFEKALLHLIKSFEVIKVSAARATIIWIIGEYSAKGDLFPEILPTIMRYLASCFASEELEAKLQILNCAVKAVISSQVKNHSTTVLAANYILDMGKNDLHYDIRDRARMLKRLLDSYVYTEKTVNNIPEETAIKGQKLGRDIISTVLNHLFSPRQIPLADSETSKRVFFPGSLSHIVQHTAPGYRSLPKPYSLYEADVKQTREITQVAADDDDSIDEEADVSYSSSYESHSGISLNHNSSRSDQANSSDELPISRPKESTRPSPSVISSKPRVQRDLDLEDNLGETVKGAENQDKMHVLEPLISLSDGEHREFQEGGNSDPFAVSDELLLMHKNALESWLETDGSTSETLSVQPRDSTVCGYANLSIGKVDIVPKRYMLLDYTKGDGLNVMYAYSNKSSSHASSMTCIQLFFHNHSDERISNIVVKGDESVNIAFEQGSPTQVVKQTLTSSESPMIIPVQEISALEPDQMLESEIHVRFHLLAPLNLHVHCQGKHYSLTLRPEIGMLLRPTNINIPAFLSKESELSGMLESTRRCTFTGVQNSSSFQDLQHGGDDKLLSISRGIVSRVLSSFHMFVVSITVPVSTSLIDQSGGNSYVKGLCLRFSGETLSSCSPCLATITAEDDYNGGGVPVLVKVNCEDVVFGLNLLKRLVEVLTGDT